MSCARCGCGIYKTEEFISLNKVWHKYCFTCYQCNKRLDKNTAKIFQGELFCECCYTCVIEKLFEVVSTPSVNRPCKVASTPSCSLNNKCLDDRLKICDNLLNKNCECVKKEYCFPVEKKIGDCKRSAQSCLCIPTQQTSKNEYCFIFPIPREVANYYNRAHMKNNACKDPVTCCSPPCSSCCQKSCCPAPRCPVQVRTLKCQCGNCCPSYRSSSPKRCCCSRSCPSQPSQETKVCGCCQPSPRPCFEPCPPKRCVSPCRSPPQCCPKRFPQPCKPRCPPSACCNSPASCPPKSCCPPKFCCPPKSCCPPKPYCPPKTCCPPTLCCPQRGDACCCPKNNSSPECSQCCCKKPTKCCYKRSTKYCVCGGLNPCDCKMSQVKAQCTACCVRCGQKVYAAEKILVSSGAFHTSCFSCYCCNKLLDVKNVFEGCGEIYCKQCYNHFFGTQYYGFGGPTC